MQHLHNSYSFLISVNKLNFESRSRVAWTFSLGSKIVTVLGLWTPFVNEREMLGWYKLPNTAVAECQAYRPDGHELDPLPARTYAAVHSRTVQFARQSVAPFKPAYHNDEIHFERTEVYGLAAADAYAARNQSKLPKLVRQSFALALRTHDAHHCGSTFRVDAPRGVYRSDLGNRVSSEWVTALAVNEFMREQGLVLPARLFQTGIIWASTYGGGTMKGQSMGIPNPLPQTVWGAIMRAADACPPRSFKTWLQESIAVNYGEVPAQPESTSMADFVARRQGFVDYIDVTFQRLDKIAGKGITQALGWRPRIQMCLKGLQRLAKGHREPVKEAQALAKQYGFTFD